jgi:hypothetical protein
MIRMTILMLTLVVTVGSFAIAQGLRAMYADLEMKSKVVRAIEGKENGWEPEATRRNCCLKPGSPLFTTRGKRSID